jgi:hypothetical protein
MTPVCSLYHHTAVSCQLLRTPRLAPCHTIFLHVPVICDCRTCITQLLGFIYCNGLLLLYMLLVDQGLHLSQELCRSSVLLRKVALYWSRAFISRTQSSSGFANVFTATAESSLSWLAQSEIDDLLMHGMGYCEAFTVTDSPGWRICDSCPSR